MRKSIFDLEIRVDIEKEFKNIKSILFEGDAIYYSGIWYNLYSFFNNEIFPVWKNKGMFIDFDDFLDKLNIDFNSNNCDESSFLYLVEVLINLWSKAIEILDFDDNLNSKRVIGYMQLSLPKIIEKLNYEVVGSKSRYTLSKRDADVDSVLDLVPSDCSTLLLEYNDIRSNDIDIKKDILKKLDLFIEDNKNEYKSLDNVTYNTVQIIVNKMGINHPIKEEPFKSLTGDELLEWYDKCFKLMLHLIRRKEVSTINNQCKAFIKE
ncbi:MAG: hypothetical protein IJK67_04770 [Bacilli bacterium]|nr:hypothetical protein [Bacilli bacterium]